MIEIRSLKGHAEYAEAVRLQRVIWGFEDVDLLPVRFFVVAASIGGQTLGAFDGSRTVGFCLAIPALKLGGKGYLHSHMLGVLKEYRDAGAGRLLKLAQREEALSRGIDLIEWTFDPLEIKNAYFNIEKLGAVVRRFVLNQYGITSSPLQAGLPTDRCIAEWHLNRERKSEPVCARISVPADMARIKQAEPRRAREIQEQVAEQFLRHFANNLAVTGFERTPESGAYLLSPWPSK